MINLVGIFIVPLYLITFHYLLIYANSTGTSQGPLYAPVGGNIGKAYNSGRNVDGSVNRNIDATYSTGLTIIFVHVAPSTGGAGVNGMGSINIGNIGGSGGNSPNYMHTHIVFKFKGSRVDPRQIFCN